MRDRFSTSAGHAALRKAGGMRMARVRELRGLSQEQVGDRMKPTRRKQAISQWERGLVDPAFSQLVELARALQCSVHYLVSGLGSPDVVTSPLSVVAVEGTLVPVADFQKDRGEQRIVRGRFKTIAEDRHAEVMDDAMAPEFRPGDTSIFRPGLVPAPGDFVWAYDSAADQHVLRQYRVVKDRTRPDTRFELVALNPNWPVEEDGAHISILGVHVELSRMYKAL